MGALVEHLRRYGGNLAVAGAVRQLTYDELADQVTAAADGFGTTRRLILLETHNDLVTLIHYLGALDGGHVVMPVPQGADHTALVAAYDPDVVVDHTGTIREHRSGTAHHLHPELALLMSTSGSTGSAKVVRQSWGNLLANAGAIAEYLGIDENDRAATTLPMSYCYGLSVIHSHLLRGAGLILTPHSVVDAEFWELFRRFGGTSFAGVPYTFELLDRVGFDSFDLPSLRYLTQAGGHLPPDRVRRFATLGERHGWEFYVMYGATEATSRMAYLPPELAASHPSSIGLPIPGGSFTIEPIDGWDELGVGELVYRGPNVMMGYAHDRSDLASGPGVDALHTGDIARRGGDGLYEIVGRASRFAKLFGLRIDLQRVESALRDRGISAFCADDDGTLAVAATAPEAVVTAAAAEATGLPPSAIAVVTVPELPLLPSGKPDYPTVRQLAHRSADIPLDGVRGLFIDILQVDPALVTSESTFVELGGNSLSYVTMSIRLERLLGTLPADWQSLTVQQLQRSRRTRRWFGATVDTSVALRAVAIVLIVISHAGMYELWGGAHILLGVAGYNFGRFCLTSVPRTARVRHLFVTVLWIAVPAVVWVAIVMMFTDDYTYSNLLLANKILGPFDSMTAGRLWFVEILVWTLVALALVIWTPLADRWERHYPFVFAAGFVIVGLALRYDMLGFGLGDQAWFTFLAFWFFAIGWAAAKASSTWQRLLVTATLLVSLLGYFGDVQRELLVGTALVLLIWVPTIRCPAGLTVAAGIIAEASLYTYLTHFQVYTHFDDHPLVGVIASLLVGVALTYLVTVARRKMASARRQRVSAGTG